MIIMISQPTFFPWLGYFDMIRLVDKVVILDDVKFNYQSWQHRNHFKDPNGLKLFTIPVIDGKKKQNINHVKLQNPIFSKNKLIKFISSNYNKSLYFKGIKHELFDIFDQSFKEGKLLNLNMGIIKWCLTYLKVNTRIIYSSDLHLKNKKTERLIEICQKLGAKEYLSTAGAIDYLDKEMHLFSKAKIKIQFHNYNHPKYNQLFDGFKEYACILDLILNEGSNSLKILKSGNLNKF